MRRLNRHLPLAAALLLLAGCATPPSQTGSHWPDPASEGVELSATPFFPQQAYQCGPAALATVLNVAGAEIMPETLTEQIYLPGRRGSLQAELIAATRRHDRVPYRLAPDLSALLQQLQAGNPVLVLQNLGVNWIPRWHYAVVIGYRPETDAIVLRSGTEPRKMMDRDLFLKTWRRADHWALVVLPPDRLPSEPDLHRYLSAVAGLEATGRTNAAIQGYRTASRRWADAPAVWYGLGNAHYRAGEYAEADTAYRHSLTLDADNAAVRNNLAQALLARGCVDAARETVSGAMKLADVPKGIRKTLQETFQEIQARQNSETQECPPPYP